MNVQFAHNGDKMMGTYVDDAYVASGGRSKAWVVCSRTTYDPKDKNLVLDITYARRIIVTLTQDIPKK